MSNRDAALKYVKGHTATAVGVVVAAALIPGSASIALIAQEGIMCYQIAKIYGQHITQKDAVRIAGSIGLASVAGQLVALEASTFTGPFAFLIKPGIAATIVRILGDQIINYFEANRILLPPPIEDRICLIGKTGTGKSSTANALTRSCYFKVNAANGSTTGIDQRIYKDSYAVVDTPGLLDSMNYDHMVMTELQRARIIVYISSQAPYGPELDFIRNMMTNHIRGEQYVLFYLNNEDDRLRMPKQHRDTIFADTVRRLDGLLPPENICSGASSPVENGNYQPARITDLEFKIHQIIAS